MFTTPRVGEVRCGKTERGVPHPQIPGFLKINASSRGPMEWRGLSPMIIGPFELIEPIIPMHHFPTGILPGFIKIDDKTQKTIVQRFENYWQGSKIYNVDVVNGVVQKEFFIRRAQLFNDPIPHRRALPKKPYGLPIAGFYHGRVMGYIESRKEVYAPTYQLLVTPLPAYRRLVEMVTQGQNILIVGPDGRDIPIEDQSLRQAIDDPTHIFGHELVLCSLLKGLIPWR